MAIKVKLIKNTKQWELMKRRLKAPNYAVQLGWFNGQNYGPENGNLPLAQVAQWVEEGQRHNNQPARPAIRTRFIPALKESNELLLVANPLINQVALGMMSWKKLHEKMAPRLLYQFKLAIETLKTPGNRPSTIEKKGFNDPWIETGTLLSSSRYRVVSYKFRTRGS